MDFAFVLARTTLRGEMQYEERRRKTVDRLPQPELLREGLRLWPLAGVRSIITTRAGFGGNMIPKWMPEQNWNTEGK